MHSTALHYVIMIWSFNRLPSPSSKWYHSSGALRQYVFNIFLYRTRHLLNLCAASNSSMSVRHNEENSTSARSNADESEEDTHIDIDIAYR